MSDIVERAVKAFKQAQKQIRADADSYISVPTGLAIRELVDVFPYLIEEVARQREIEQARGVGKHDHSPSEASGDRCCACGGYSDDPFHTTDHPSGLLGEPDE